jgi:RNA polymerase sigma-70 factor (ECF subfamily)
MKADDQDMNPDVAAEAHDRDAALVRAAQGGEIAALGLLLERHEPGMRAVALSILGPGPDAQDVVQDAALSALRRIADLRDPKAVGPWLRMIVRNRCHTVLRDAHRTEPLESLPSSLSGDPQQSLERSALRDWIWEAVEQLSPTLRLPLVLRHFSQNLTSYEQIAQICGVPVGTVRSRLSQGRTKLAAALTATASTAHSDVRQRTVTSWQQAHATIDEAERGNFAAVLAQHWSPEVRLMRGASAVGGREFLLHGMEGDLATGVRQRPRHVVAGQSLAVWEMDLISPQDNPQRCPPAVAWIMNLSGGRVRELRLHHAPLVAATPDHELSRA